MLATNRLAGVTPDVNLRECLTCTPPPSANKAAHSGFETQTRRISGSTQKGRMPSKKNKKKTKNSFLIHLWEPEILWNLDKPCTLSNNLFGETA